jgi:hypothetical protein
MLSYYCPLDDDQFYLNHYYFRQILLLQVQDDFLNFFKFNTNARTVSYFFLLDPEIRCHLSLCYNHFHYHHDLCLSWYSFWILIGSYIEPCLIDLGDYLIRIDQHWFDLLSQPVLNAEFFHFFCILLLKRCL